MPEEEVAEANSTRVGIAEGGITKPEEASPSLKARVEGALKLKDYAIANNLYVSDAIIRQLNEAKYGSGSIESHASEIDSAIRDLTAITYPATIETLELAGESGLGTVRTLVWSLVVIGGVIFFVAVYGYKQSQTQTQTLFWPSSVAACLGALGSLVYIFFNLIGVIREKTFSREDSYAHVIRLFLGAIVGWVFFIAFTSDKDKSGLAQPLLFLLPFVSGFSTRLVVGLINQVIQAIELTMGLESKNADLLRRRSQAPPPKT
jgi:hypothetical protein